MMPANPLEDPAALVKRRTKIVIGGSPGAGKTLFANQLGQQLQLPVFTLDTYFWRPGWERTPTPERLDLLAQITVQPGWILDGVYSDTLDFQIRAAEVLILLELNRLICLSRVIRRRLSYVNKSRPMVAPGCPDKIDREFLTEIWNYLPSKGNLIRQALRAVTDPPPVFILTTPAQITSFLKKLA